MCLFLGWYISKANGFDQRIKGRLCIDPSASELRWSTDVRFKLVWIVGRMLLTYAVLHRHTHRQTHTHTHKHTHTHILHLH